MAKGKMRIGYAIMTLKGALLQDSMGGYVIFKRRADAIEWGKLPMRPKGAEIVRVTIDTDN